MFSLKNSENYILLCATPVNSSPVYFLTSSFELRAEIFFGDAKFRSSNEQMIRVRFISNLVRKFFHGGMRATVLRLAGNSLKVATYVHNELCLAGLFLEI